MSHRVQVVCHRGANEYAPENTYAAAQRCVAWGADYVEIDVNRSSDGVHYLYHGPELENTTNGAGLITETPSAVLDQLDAGSWFGAEFTGERMPRLDEFLRWIKGKAKVYLDIKDADLAYVVALLYEVGLEQECFLWSERDEIMRELHRIAPELPLKYNVYSMADIGIATEEFGAVMVEVQLKDMSQALVAECRRRGLKIMIRHGRKEAGAFRQVLRWGVDLVNLDHADLFYQVMEDFQAEFAVKGFDPTPLPSVKRAVLVMLDGCRGDALEAAQTPTFDRLRCEGAWTLTAQSVMPTSTLPCHTSIFHSQMPTEHGVVSNTWTPSAAIAPSLISAIHDAGYETAAFYTWEQLRDLAPPGKLDRVHFRRLSYAAFDELAATAITTIVALKPTFSFVYLEAPDALGHLYGWMSPRYLEAVERVDKVVGQLLEALETSGDLAETLFIVMADHGGHGRGHGTDSAEDMNVPWLIWGPGIRPGHHLTCEVRLIDVAPTLLYAMGIPQPAAWRGEIVRESFL